VSAVTRDCPDRPKLPLKGGFLRCLQLARRLLCSVGKDDDNHLLSETPMNTFSSKLSALAATLLMNCVIMGSVGYLFEVQSHPHMSVISFAKAIVAHQWLI
jgi:hypothetical protein